MRTLRAIFAIRVFLVAASAVLSFVLPSAADDSRPEAELVSVRRIWDRAPHNAFTDLMWHDGRWYCVFREGSQHVSPDGALRVITSREGERWESLALITHPDADLRDAKLSIAPGGQFMLNGAGMQAEELIRYRSMVWFSRDQGSSWSDGTEIGDPGFWLWRAHWHEGSCYSMGYRTDRNRDERVLRFYKSCDGIHYRPHVDQVDVPNGVGEDKLLFLDDGSALCLLRHETGDKAALLGKSPPPYTEWSWQDLGVRIGGPNMIQIPDNRIVAATRLYDSRTRTSLSWIDPEAGRMTEFLALPSGGDTSYAGLVWHDGLLWISYYSSHEGKACIYLAKVRILSS